MSWYVIKDDQKIGPFSDKELSFLIETHEVGPDDLVWKEGIINWTKASKVSGLFTPPKVPDEAYKGSDSQLPEDTEDENILVSEGLSGNEGVNKRSYLVRHWRGELNLPVSYWINGLLITASITLLAL